jgi:hypothetical protein
MKIFYHTSIFFLSLISFNLNSQILIGEEPVEVKKDSARIRLKDEITPKRDLLGSTEAVFSSTWSKSNRKLIENGDKYGKPLGLRADETSLDTWSYSLEFRHYATKHFAFQAGISYMRNGESYAFKDTDTSYNYTSTYTYTAMPIRLMYYHGDEIRFFGGVGFIPAMFNKYSTTENWKDSKGIETSASSSTKNGFNTVLFSATIHAGIQLKYSKSWSIFCLPEYRWQLNSTFLKQAAFQHYARAFSINFGLVYQFK